MSTTTKKSAPKGVRYTDAQKKEVVDFVNAYNAANGRGGQSKAAEKFNISQLTVATWLKNAGASPKAEKAPKADKKAKAAKAGASRVGTRYSDEQKKEVVDFAVDYNAANGRGGQSKAAAKFNVSPLTVVAWMKAAGVKGAAKKGRGPAAKAPKASGTSADMSSKLNTLLSLSNKIAETEGKLAQLKSEFNAIKASL